MSNLIETLCQLTQGEYWSNTQNFQQEFTNRFYNGAEILEQINMSECNQFHDNGCNAELSIYNDRQRVFSCCYSEYYNQKIITCIYDKNGLVYEYNIDYDEMDKQFAKKKRR